MISVSHLSFAFGRHWILRDVSFDVQKGEFLFLTGPSGAGKTTLMRILHGALKVDRGRVLVADQDLSSRKGANIPKLRREVGVVFQDFKILENRTVSQNVALPLEIRGLAQDKIERRVRAVLRSLQMAKKAEVPCRELSGGEQQRVAIARAMVVNPKLLLADEPTGNLDFELAKRLLMVFRQFNLHGTTVIFATHNPEIINSDPGAKILSLSKGSLTVSNRA